MTYEEAMATAKRLADQLAEEMIFRGERRISVDDELHLLVDTDAAPILEAMNAMDDNRHFRLEDVYGSYGKDLVETDVKAKAAYDALPNPHTRGELWEKVKDECGITSDAPFHQDPNEQMTEDEFNQAFSFYQSLPGVFK